MRACLPVIIFLIFIASCSSKKPVGTGSGSVIVLNEGNFQHGNASLSIYNPISKSITNDIFSLENGGALLGDVAQSLCLLNDTAFIVINNSQKVVIADAANNFKYIDTIFMPGASPRYFLPVGGSKAYITELYANKIWVVDFRLRSILKTIPVSGWTENLYNWGGKVLVQEQTTPFSSNPIHAILLIDPDNDRIVNSIDLNSDPGSMALTTDNQLFVLCPAPTGVPSGKAHLYNIDLPSLSVARTFSFDSTRTPAYIRYSNYSNQLLFSDNEGIFKMLPSDTNLPSQVFIPSQSWNVYGMNVNPENGDLYISNALDYQQASNIMRYSNSGMLIDQFKAGIITNGFVFE